MKKSNMTNQYMQQVMEQKKEVEQNLKVKRRAKSSKPDFKPMAPTPQQASAPDSHDAPAVEVRVTGFWRFKNVIVPPNTYVVHTRRGFDKPLHIGLGLSFKFDPNKDSFLVVPSAMQTIIVNASCICKERQGIMVQGYVQWVIEDFSVAYRKLEFSDPVDPMSVVNVQLREQAEAAIKDTVATMSIDDVLSDKQPIIQELTTRLKQVAEGNSKEEGLGLRIVTVQIKEAVVCSAQVWDSLQREFRAERFKEARLAELSHQAIVNERESEEAKKTAFLKIKNSEEVSTKQAEAESKTFERTQAEKAKRAELEAHLAEKLAINEQKTIEIHTGLEKLKLENKLLLSQLKSDDAFKEAQKNLELEALQRKIENQISSERLQEQLIEQLPSIIKNMPKASEVKNISINNSDLEKLTTTLSQLFSMFTDSGKSSKKP